MNTEHDCCKLKVKSSIWENHQDISKSVTKPKNEENIERDKLVWYTFDSIWSTVKYLKESTNTAS